MVSLIVIGIIVGAVLIIAASLFLAYGREDMIVSSKQEEKKVEEVTDEVSEEVTDKVSEESVGEEPVEEEDAEESADEEPVSEATTGEDVSSTATTETEVASPAVETEVSEEVTSPAVETEATEEAAATDVASTATIEVANVTPEVTQNSEGEAMQTMSDGTVFVTEGDQVMMILPDHTKWRVKAANSPSKIEINGDKIALVDFDGPETRIEWESTTVLLLPDGARIEERPTVERELPEGAALLLGQLTEEEYITATSKT
jgi:cytoskeletal protein RodZ